jgi:exosortase A
LKQASLTSNRNLLVVASVIVLIPAIFFETTLAMVDVWITNETFTHGFLIFPISLWLIWQKRETISVIIPSSEPRVLVLILPVLAFWFIGRMVDVEVVQQLTMLSLVSLTIWLILGRWVLLALLFPFMYLFFAVPLGQSLIPPMMDFTADFTVTLIKLTGIPIYRDGLYFTLPSGNWSVVEECSGVRYLIASLALGTIYAYITYQSYAKRSIFFVMAIIVPILANGLRAFGIVMLGHFSGMTLAVGADHLLYGWVFFGIIIFLMFYIGNFWADKPLAENAGGKIEQVDPSDPAKVKIQPSLILLLALVFTATSLYSFYLAHRQFTVPQDITHRLPGNFEGWQYDENLGLAWQPETSNADVKTSKTYRFGSEIVQTDVSVFLYQRQGAEAISSVNRLTNPYGGAWRITYSSDLQENDIFVRENELRRSNQKILVWSWYRVGQLDTPNRYIAKFLEAYQRIFTSRTDVSIISIATPLRENKQAAQDRLREFWGTAEADIKLSIDSLVQQNELSAD